MASHGEHHHHHHHDHDHDHNHHHEHDHDGEKGEGKSWVGKDGRVYHSHDGLAPHSHEPIYSPGFFSRRAPPLNRNFNERAFTVGIGGPVGTGWVPLSLCIQNPSKVKPFFIFMAMQENSSHVGPLWIPSG